MLGEIKDSNILDYGCGQGDFIELLLNTDNKPKSIYAVDSNPQMIDTIKENFVEEIQSSLVIPKVCVNPDDLMGISKFDKIFCHNVLECLEDKIKFINEFEGLLSDDGVFILSHHDFDSAIFNSHYKELTRDLVHCFADTQQDWQKHSDGQMGRKIPGLISQSVFHDKAVCTTLRLCEREFVPGNYGHLMAEMILAIAEPHFKEADLQLWYQDLETQNINRQYYFAIDLVVALISKVAGFKR